MGRWPNKWTRTSAGVVTEDLGINGNTDLETQDRLTRTV